MDRNYLHSKIPALTQGLVLLKAQLVKKSANFKQLIKIFKLNLLALYDVKRPCLHCLKVVLVMLFKLMFLNATVSLHYFLRNVGLVGGVSTEIDSF